MITAILAIALTCTPGTKQTSIRDADVMLQKIKLFQQHYAFAYRMTSNSRIREKAEHWSEMHRDMVQSEGTCSDWMAKHGEEVNTMWQTVNRPGGKNVFYK